MIRFSEEICGESPVQKNEEREKGGEAEIANRNTNLS